MARSIQAARPLTRTRRAALAQAVFWGGFEAFERHARDAGLPAIPLHSVRHSYATAALAAGVPTKVLSERLGHSSISITADTYQHVLPELDDQAAARVAAAIFGS